VTGRAAAFASGALLGGGLLVSGMTEPAAVQGFLDVAGDWDPSLALVMLAAVAVHMLGLRLVARRSSPLFGGEFPAPRRRAIDGRLLAGAALFGVGWGMAGFCPGPALVAAGGAQMAALVFVATMTAGMLVRAWMAARPSP
jgi:uncharacterized protein